MTALCRNALARKLSIGFMLELPPNRINGGEVIVGATLKGGAGVIVLQVGCEQAEGTQQPGITWDQNGPAAERAAKLDPMQRAGAAERHEREILRIIPPLDGNDFECTRHVGVDNSNHAFGRVLNANAKWLSDVALNCCARLLHV